MMIEPNKLKELLKSYVHDIETHEATNNAQVAIERVEQMGDGMLGLSNRIDSLLLAQAGMVKKCEELDTKYVLLKGIIDKLQEEVSPVILKHHKKLFK